MIVDINDIANEGLAHAKYKNYYGIALEILREWRKRGENKMIAGLGKRAVDDFNGMNDFHNLYFHLSLLKDRLDRKLAIDPTYDIAVDLNALVCVICYFQCLHINVEPLLNVFGFSFKNGCPTTPDGINYMQIEGLGVNVNQVGRPRIS